LEVPIYEYQCNKCEHKLETLQKISDKPLKKCPECGKQSLRKLVSAAAFRLSGSGWYETDFKDKKEQKNLSISDNKQPDSGDSKKSDSASDSKKSDSAGDSKKSDSTDSKKASSSSDSATTKKATEAKPVKKASSDD
jgi:putative FmdB family regulatory protein